jgi:two-component system KDP operon response regulator KdpE
MKVGCADMRGNFFSMGGRAMASKKPLLLLIDDDASLRRYLSTLLAGAGYDVEVAENGQQGLDLAHRKGPAVVVLDLGLPDIDGQELLLQLRDRMQMPIVVLSAREDPVEKIAALDHGADDYLTKPFSSGELLARLRLALRHHALGSPADQSPLFEFGDLRVDLFGHRVVLGENEIHLTPIEFKMLSLLVRHAGRVLQYQYLLNEVWGPAATQGPQNVRVMIAGLRRKIEADPARPRYLLTEQGIGYRLMPSDVYSK